MGEAGVLPFLLLCKHRSAELRWFLKLAVIAAPVSWFWVKPAMTTRSLAQPVRVSTWATLGWLTTLLIAALIIKSLLNYWRLHFSFPVTETTRKGFEVSGQKVQLCFFKSQPRSVRIHKGLQAPRQKHKTDHNRPTFLALSIQCWLPPLHLVCHFQARTSVALVTPLKALILSWSLACFWH